ncbi:MAG: MarR family transcriptional regulator [Rhodococcus ruber]|nr:MarR family transcriptional regulator [Rhodococcus ruber]
MEASATTALVLAARLAAQSIETVLSSDELNMDHFLVLEALAVRPGLTMAELRDRTRTPAPTLTRVVDRLVSVAAVYREVDAHDRRKTRVYLSVRGKKLFDRLSVFTGGFTLEAAEAPPKSSSLRFDLKSHRHGGFATLSGRF